MVFFLGFSMIEISYVNANNNEAVFDQAEEKALNAFERVKKIILILGAFGILTLAVMAFFGRFNVMWFVSLIGGMILVLLVGQIITYLTGVEDVLDP